MSNKWLTQVWSKSPYKGAARLVHLNLADRANKEGISWPSKRRILQDCRLKSPERLREIFVMMEKDDLLYREFRDGKSTNYHLQPIPDPPDTEGRGIPLERGGSIPLEEGVVSPQSTALEPSVTPIELTGNPVVKSEENSLPDDRLAKSASLTSSASASGKATSAKARATAVSAYGLSATADIDSNEDSPGIEVLDTEADLEVERLESTSELEEKMSKSERERILALNAKEALESDPDGKDQPKVPGTAGVEEAPEGIQVKTTSISNEEKDVIADYIEEQKAIQKKLNEKQVKRNLEDSVMGDIDGIMERFGG